MDNTPHIPWPHNHTAQAIAGWLGLGNLQEAEAELSTLPLELAQSPPFLQLAWEIHAGKKDWRSGLAVAQELIQTAPDHPAGWIWQAYCLRRMDGGGLTQAKDALLPATKLFPKEDIIPYNLACYEAQLNNLGEAWEWLHRAMEIAGSVEKIKLRALGDEDLQLLWDRLREL